MIIQVSKWGFISDENNSNFFQGKPMFLKFRGFFEIGKNILACLETFFRKKQITLEENIQKTF